MPLATKQIRSMHQHMVHTFMMQAGQAIPDKPSIPSAEIRVLRARLIYEEAMETIDALGVSIYHKFTCSGDEEAVFEAVGEPDLVKILDGCCDIHVVTTGCELACGISGAVSQYLIDTSNLAKFSRGGYKSDGTDGNPIGKWIKPPDWRPPDLALELRLQGWEG